MIKETKSDNSVDHQEIEKLEQYESHIGISFFAPYCYFRSFTIDLKKGVELLKKYMISVEVFEVKYDRLYPIKKFLDQADSLDVFDQKEVIETFVEEVYPYLSEKDNWLRDLTEIGLNIEELCADFPGLGRMIKIKYGEMEKLINIEDGYDEELIKKRYENGHLQNSIQRGLFDEFEKRRNHLKKRKNIMRSR